MIIALTALCTFGILWAKGLYFPVLDLAQPVATFAALSALAYFRPYFAHPLRAVAFLVLYTSVYGVLMDAVAAHHTALYDSWLIVADSWLGCNVAGCGTGPGWLRLVYFSLVPQIILAVWLLSCDQQIFLRRFVFVTLLAAVALALVPCRGNYTGAHGLDAIANHFDSLRTATVVTWKNAEGIITMPSVHAATAVLLIAGFWNTLIRWPILLLNVLMIASCIPVGRHYVVDLLAGGLIAAAAIYFVKRVDNAETCAIVA